jgi:hypothetical protein
MSIDATLKLLLHGISRITSCCLMFGYLVNIKSSVALFNQIRRMHMKLKGILFLNKIIWVLKVSLQGNIMVTLTK